MKFPKILLVLFLVMATLVIGGSLSFAGELIPTSLDNARIPAYDYWRANKLPMTGYFEKSFSVAGENRTAKIYISPEAPIRSFFTVIAVPDGIDTNDFLLKSGWKDIADANDECLFILEPGKNPWGKPEYEQAYINAAIDFYKSNNYFSIFGIHYFVGYDAGGTALEAWAAANPLFVISQAYVETNSLSDTYYAQFASKYFDGKSTGYTPIEIPDKIKIAYNEVPVPTWYINSNLSRVAAGIKYWKNANDCVASSIIDKDYLYGSQVYAQAKDSNAWQTDYSGPISKVATLQKKPNIWDAQFSNTIYDFLIEYTRYDNTIAYGNQLALRKPWGEIHTMMVNGYPREYMIYMPDSAADLWPDGAPVMFVWAGNSQTDKVFWEATMWWKVADDEGLILVIPCEQYSTKSTVVSHADSDIFFVQLAELVKKYYKVDPTRFYSTGQSAGGGVTTLFGMTNPEYFAAIALTSGLRPVSDDATYAMLPAYACVGEGDGTNYIGTLWDDIDNNLDKSMGYYIKANGLDLGDGSNIEEDGRFTTWTWRDRQGVPLVKLTRTAYRAHNNIMAEMPMLWDFAKHFSHEVAKDGTVTRYYSASGFKKDDKVEIMQKTN